MKTNKLLTYALSLMVLFTITSCVEDDDFTIPSNLGTEENLGLQRILDSVAMSDNWSMMSIADVKNLYNGAPTAIESNIVVKGYVSSSDLTGNFYKEFYMQDAPENPTAAIGILLNQVDSYNQFNKGREVYVSLNGLYIGENSNELLSIGLEDGDEVTEITAAMVPDYIFRSDVTETIVPLVVDPSDINSSHLGMFVSLENMQFLSDLEGRPFVDPYDDFDTQRAMSSCESGYEFDVFTSSFASFSDLPVPTEFRGTISGVVYQTYGGDEIVLSLNDTNDIDFNDQRCDPVFEEGFGSAIDNTELNIDGWINYAEAGSVVWTEQVYSGNGYAELNPYNSGDSSNIAWLITPGIDMDAQTGETFTFATEHAYPDAGHDPLEVLISTDFDGTEDGVTTATWTTLTVNKSYIVDFDTWFTWVSSGSVDLSSYTGTAYIAFRYTGSDTSNQNMTLHVDNVKISVD